MEPANTKWDQTSSNSVIRPESFVSDRELIEAIHLGSRRAADALYERHGKAVRGILVRVLGIDESWDDAVQQTFAEVFASLHTVRNPDNLRAWLRGVAVHVARRIIRSRQRDARFHAETDERDIPAEEVSSPSTRAVYRVLERLPCDERIALSLRWIDGCSLAEVAALCRCSKSTAQRRLRRGEKRFARIVDGSLALQAVLNRGRP